MTQERKTAGLLPRPVWLIVRPDEDDDQRRALGPIRTVDKLRGVAEGVSWANPGDEIMGYVDAVPEGAIEIDVDGFVYEELAKLTFEQQLINILWFDYKEGRWDEEKEWNADRWQDVGMLLESFGIEFPGADAPKPPDAEEEDEEEEDP
jgi:hypothetical protein